ncbi:3-demethylubiquinone-9 3-methyltransferase [Aspergillus ibericus CBS 121593]|uniref:Ubiquinone biosynthesis O-methyltransferase, mitochondrial n=1 Tax=Aspergillus ibericus CBS 121593 TaxID=1448316 RepID=A0A395H7Y1_9EURO|nr:ubiquinone biosynthesis O-methyltransferase [Aspergillus ibericus CBS 121593]RAL04017.1 ubiquinone biosynthesis O-methyltransferase [Aspergillus ibericus CBS 121593]
MLRPTLRTLPSTLKSLTTTRLHSTTTTTATTSVSPNELSHFSSLASSWWDPQGPSRVLHLMNPVRHDFIASCLAESTPITTIPSTPTDAPKRNTLRYLDIGCGGGIFAESLARTIPTTTDPASSTPTRTRAAEITALDPSSTLIKIARDHARLDPVVEGHLETGRFKYVNSTLEEYIPTLTSTTTTPTSTTNGSQEGGKKFDVVTLFEVIEHIDNVPGSITPQGFLSSCLSMVKPGGWLIGSTIARTFPSWIVNQVIAEAPWPVGVVPKGTHEWSKFVNPGELQAWVQEGLMRGADGGARRGGSEVLEGMSWRCEGVVYFPGLGWKIVKGSESWGNYFWAVRKGV